MKPMLDATHSNCSHREELRDTSDGHPDWCSLSWRVHSIISKNEYDKYNEEKETKREKKEWGEALQ